MKTFTGNLRRTSVPRALRGRLATTVLMLAAFSTQVRADVIRFHIASQPMPSALRAFAEQAHMQVLYDFDAVAALRCNPVEGELDKREALRQLLLNTGLEAVFGGGDAAAVRPVRTDATVASAPQESKTSSSPSRSQMTPGVSEASTLSEVIVTARKMEGEPLSDVPMSISVITGPDIEKGKISNLQDAARVLPGLSAASSGPGQNQLTVRGISGNNTVGLYVDDTPLTILNAQAQPDNWSMDPLLLDLQRIEVLRGPQGTLYGAGSLGGTVRYVTNPPDASQSYFIGRATVSDTEGGGWNQEVAALLNSALVPERVGLRAAVFERDYSGYIDRYPTSPNDYLAVLPAPVDPGVNSERTYGGRLAVSVGVTEHLSAVFSASYQSMRLGSQFTFDSPQGSLDHPIQSRLVSDPSIDDTSLYALTIHADVGAAHLTSSTSYFDRDFHITEDDSKGLAAFFPLPEGAVYPSALMSSSTNHNFVHETRAAVDMGRVHAVAGFYYAHAVANGEIDWPKVPQYVPILGDQSIFEGHTNYIDRQTALFADATIDLTEKLRGTFGARVFWYEQTLEESISGALFGGSTSLSSSASAHGVTPKYDLAYYFRPTLMAYATVDKGFREGGPGFPVGETCISDYRALYPEATVGTLTTYKPDWLWNYEVGIRASAPAAHLAMSGAVYTMRWSDIQQLILLPCGYTFTGNFGRATSKGIDAEVHYEPVSGLRLALALALNEAQITASVSGAQAQPGQQIEYAPRWSAAASAEYGWALRPNLWASARVSWNTTSGQRTGYDSASSFYNMGGYSLTNLNLGVKRGAWQATLFVNNLFNKHAEVDLYNAYGVNAPDTQPWGINRPRTIGFELRFAD